MTGVEYILQLESRLRESMPEFIIEVENLEPLEGFALRRFIFSKPGGRKYNRVLHTRMVMFYKDENCKAMPLEITWAQEVKDSYRLDEKEKSEGTGE